MLGRSPDIHAVPLGLAADDIVSRMREIEQVVHGALKPTEALKARLEALAGEVNRSTAEIARLVSRNETAKPEGGSMASFATLLEEKIRA